MLSMQWRRRVVGIAIGSGEAIACIPKGDASHWIQRAGIDDGASALRSLLDAPELRSVSRRRGVRIALLPPLVEDRIIRLPRLTAGQAERALAVQAARYFASAPKSPVVACRALDADGEVLASASSTELIADIHTVLRDARIRCLGLFSGVAAVLHIGTAIHGIRHGGVVISGIWQDSRLAAVRRRPIRCSTSRNPCQSADTDVDENTLPEALFLAADTISRDVLSTAELCPQALIDSRKKRARLRAGSMAFVAALGFVGGLHAEARQVNQQLLRTRTDRAASRMAVASALDERNQYENLQRTLQRVWTGTTAQSVPATLSSIIADIPLDVELDMLEIDQDALILSGTSARADAVFTAIRRSHLVSTVEWIGPVSGVTDNGMRRESFGIAARLQGSW
jgi:hypothetical protein